MNVKTLISVLQKEVKPTDRGNANIYIWCGDQEYEIESMSGFSYSPDIVIKLKKTVTPTLQPLKFKNEHKRKVAKIEEKIKKDTSTNFDKECKKKFSPTRTKHYAKALTASEIIKNLGILPSFKTYGKKN
jgi:hypothetical protein